MSQTRKIIVDENLATELLALKMALNSGGHNTVVIQDEGGDVHPISTSAAGFLRDIIESGVTSRLTIEPLSQHVTTTVAADLLGTTRPTLRKWIRAGIIPAHKVGSHTRLNTADVLRLRAKRCEERSQSFEDLRAFEEKHLPVRR